MPTIKSLITGLRGKQEVKQPRTKTKGLLANWLDFSPKKLSTEKTVSKSLIESYNEWVFMNVSVLAEEVSKLQPELFKVIMKGGKLELEEVIEHPVLDLLDQWNEVTTSSDGFYLTEAHLDLTGDSFWYLEGGLGGKPPEKIYLLRPDKVELELGDFTKEQGVMVNNYIYKDNVDGKPVQETYDPTEILHIKVPNPGNAYRGKSTVEAIWHTLLRDDLSNESSKKFYEQGMMAQFVLQTEQKLNQDQLKQMQAELRSAYMGARNAWKVPIFGGGITAKELQITNKDAEFMATQEWLRDKIMVAFKNTKASLGIVEDVNRANAEATLSGWKRSVIKPKIGRIIDSINEFILPRYGDNLILGFKDPVPEDRQAKIDEVAKLMNTQNRQVITVNEAREMLDMEALEGDENDTLQGITPADPSIPESVKNVNYKRAFRKNKIITKLETRRKLKEDIKPKIREMIKKRSPQKPSRRTYRVFWKRIAEIIEQVEVVFGSKLQNFITQLVDEAQSNLDNEDARQNGDLFNEELKIAQAQAEFAPVLTQALISAGNEANKLLGIDKPYLPKSVKQAVTEEQIKKQIELFAVAMLDTDKEIMAGIIAEGLKAGSSIPEIRKQIQEKFAEYSKTQAERITRTEVATSANRGIVDAYKSSGVVVAKQWLTAPDACAYCAPMNGQIIGLDDSYFDQGSQWLGNADKPLPLDYRSIEEPPLHPNCRCTTIAVIEGVEPLIEVLSGDVEVVKLKQTIADLEKKIDKRTKSYRDLKKKSLDDQDYIKQLEVLIDE